MYEHTFLGTVFVLHCTDKIRILKNLNKSVCCCPAGQARGNALHLGKKKEKIFTFYLLQTGSSAEVGALHSVSKESLSDGYFDSGQKEVP